MEKKQLLNSIYEPIFEINYLNVVGARSLRMLVLILRDVLWLVLLIKCKIAAAISFLPFQCANVCFFLASKLS